MASWRRPPRWLLIVASIGALYTLFGFLILPPILRAQLEKRLPAVLHRPVHVREVRFNPFAMSLTVRGFSATERDGSPFVSFDELYVDVAVWKHLRGGVHLQEVRLVQPTVSVAIEKGGALSFADLLAPEGTSSAATSKKPNEKPLIVEIGRIELDRGAIAFTDRNRAQPFSARLEPLSFVLDGFTTEPRKDGDYDFKAHLAPSTELVWSGNIETSPFRSSGTLSITGVQLAQFASYLSEATQLRITKGALDLRGQYTFDASQTPSVVRLKEGSVTLTGLQVEPPGRDEALVALDSLAVTGISADATARSAHVKSVALDGLNVLARRGKDGKLELTELAKPPASSAPAASASANTAQSPWNVRVDALQLSKSGVLWEDHVPPETARVQVSELALQFGPYVFPGDEPSTFQTSMHLDGTGTLTAQGTAHAASASAELDFALADVGLPPFQPYLAPYLNARLARGTLEVKGHSRYAPSPNGGAADTTFSGDVAVKGFELDDLAGKALVGFDRLTLGHLTTDTATLDTRIDQVSLAGARVHYRVDEAKRDNFSNLLRSDRTDAAAPPKRAGPAAKTAIRRIALSDFAVDVTDRSVQPAFSTRLSSLGGTVSPYTQPGLTRSRVALAGRLDGAKVVLEGTVLPAGKDSDVDLTFALAPWNLPPTTPYGIHYMGYPIQRGTLSLDLKYKVAQRKLEASNLVTIDQLELGDSVESPTATKLPVKLALAILTDRDGKLEIDLPMEGSLDDPDFRFGKLVVHTVLNVLEKAALSPFSLLGSLFGSKEDLSAIAFDAGSSQLGADGQKKVAQLAKALVERPALKLSIIGVTDPRSDRDALGKRALQDALVAWRRAATPVGKTPPPDDQPLSDAERLAGLKALFQKGGAGEQGIPGGAGETAGLSSTRAPPTTPSGATGATLSTTPVATSPTASADALEQTLAKANAAKVTADDFAALSRARAEAVRDALEQVQGLDRARVFISTAQPTGSAQRGAQLQLQ